MTPFPPPRSIAEPLNWNSLPLPHLALWVSALVLGFVAGSEPGAVEGLHHIQLSHGNKRHHVVPVAIHRSPASLRAGHSEYLSSLLLVCERLLLLPTLNSSICFASHCCCAKPFEHWQDTPH